MILRMSVKKKLSNDYTTVRLSKKAYAELQLFQKLIPRLTGTGEKPERVELTLNRIF